MLAFRDFKFCSKKRKGKRKVITIYNGSVKFPMKKIKERISELKSY